MDRQRDGDDPTAWVGAEDHLRDTVEAGRLRRLASSLGVEPPELGSGATVPPLWHWALFLPATPRDGTGTDGHPKRGGFLPPIGRRRRMFAGGRIEFLSPIDVGSTLHRRGTVLRVEEKSARSGPLTVVTVRYEIGGERGVLVTEEQDLVYTDAVPGPPPDGPGSIPDAPWEQSLVTDEVLLFRFSAITFNSHRIHYDRSYATAVEGYPDLVVHGPLTAVLLAEMVRARHGGTVTEFSFRARAPLYVGETIHLRGWPERDTIRLAALRPDGATSVEATAIVD